jgi:hypothetical protein
MRRFAIRVVLTFVFFFATSALADQILITCDLFVKNASKMLPRTKCNKQEFTSDHEYSRKRISTMHRDKTSQARYELDGIQCRTKESVDDIVIKVTSSCHNHLYENYYYFETIWPVDARSLVYYRGKSIEKLQKTLKMTYYKMRRALKNPEKKDLLNFGK